MPSVGIAPGSFAWTPRTKDAGPYPGLAHFGEEDAGIFFGREAEIMTGLTKLRQMRKRRSPRLLVIQAASGAGKSSYLRAGLWPRLQRDPDFVPLTILRPALGILTGPDGFGRRFAPWLDSHGRKLAPADIHARLFRADPEALVQFVADAAALATGIRRSADPEARPPAPIIAIDQGEELFAAENASESTRFLDLLAPLLRAPSRDVDPYVLLTIRADSVEALLQRWPALGLEAPEVLYLPPLSPDAYREIITRPAEVYSQRVRRLAIEPALASALARNSGGADALPLLAFTLERLFGEAGTDGNLTFPRYESMGGMEGSIDRALAEARRKAGAGGSEAMLHQLVVPGLATWDPAANAAKRLVAREADLIGSLRTDMAPLANALVDARLLTRGRDTIEVAHEALLRRPPIAGWLEAQKDALKLRDDVLREAGEWAGGGKAGKDLVRRGERLAAARALAADPGFAGALAPAKDYLAASRRVEAAAAARTRRIVALLIALMWATIGGLTWAVFKTEIEAARFAWWDEPNFRLANFEPFALKPEAEHALKPGDPIHECGPATHCPEMVVLPAGSFMMGADGDEKGHKVTIAKPFAVAKHVVTWDDWNVCVVMRSCTGANWYAGGFPVDNVNHWQAKSYAAWLSRMTGKDYRLLTEAEWEYAARGVTSADAPHPAYPWGDTITHENANYGMDQCSDGKTEGKDEWFKTSPVGKFPANAFGLNDMHGNVWQWVADGWHDAYAVDSPTDGSEWTNDANAQRVVRGGSWRNTPDVLRSANRGWGSIDNFSNNIGFRLGRTLDR